jgi:hypothetical protein
MTKKDKRGELLYICSCVNCSNVSVPVLAMRGARGLVVAITRLIKTSCSLPGPFPLLLFAALPLRMEMLYLFARKGQRAFVIDAMSVLLSAHSCTVCRLTRSSLVNSPTVMRSAGG